MSKIFWMISGIINTIAGIWIWIVFWPNWSFRVPADFFFKMAAPIGLMNIILAAINSRFWLISLLLNALCGLFMGMFAAFELESFTAWMLGTFLGTAPSAIALVSKVLGIIAGTTEKDASQYPGET